MLTKIEAVKLLSELRDAVREFENWQPTTEQMVKFGDRQIKPIGEALKQAIIEKCQPFQTVDIEVGARELTLAVDILYAEFSSWLVSLQAAPGAVDPSGTNEMWDAYRAVLRVLDTRKPPAPSPPHVLVTQKNYPATIARKLGWFTEDGRPDTDRVNRELAAAPADREYNPAEWVHPRDRRFAAEIDAKFQIRNERLLQTLGQSKRSSVERKPCTQSYEELARLPYITVRQIAMKKMVSEEEAARELESLGYVACPEGFRRANASYVRKGDEEPDWLTRHDPHDECGEDIEARIVKCYEDGLTRPKSIADLLTGSRNLPVTAQQVGKVIKEHKKSQESAA